MSHLHRTMFFIGITSLHCWRYSPVAALLVVEFIVIVDEILTFIFLIF